MALCCLLPVAKIRAASDVKVVEGTTEIPNGGMGNFGAVNVGVSVSKIYTFSNAGPNDMLNIGFSLTGAHTADYTLNVSPPAGLLPLGSFTFSVTFHPTTAFTRTAAVRITSNDPDENPFNINLTGIGTAPEISVTYPGGTLVDDSSTVNFGKVKVGISGSRVLTIRNAGNTTLSNLSRFVSGTGFSVSPLPVTSLAANASTQITLTFTPSGTFTSTGSLSISSNDADESPFTIALTGAGVIPLLEVESPPGTQTFDGADNLDFSAPAGQQTQQQFLLRNVSAGPLTGLALSLDGPDAAQFSTSALPSTSLAPGAVMTFTLTFSPPAIATGTAALHIAFAQSPGDPFDIALTGYGVTLSDTGDEDGDGVLNMLEVAMGTDPLTAGPSPGLLVMNGANLEYTFTRSVTGQFTYIMWVEYSDDPAGVWTPLDASFSYLDAQNGDIQTLRYVFPAGESGKRYARIRATRL